MDRTLEVRTPESIAFSYELAGLGSRFLALAVDQAIQAVVLVAIFAGLLLAGEHVKASGPVKHVLPEKVVESLAIALIVAIAFVVLFVYFIVFEALWEGQTPGKKLLGIRVVRDGGYPIDFGASLIRNLIRIGEQLVGYYILSAISMLISHENKRLGDIAAGTIVVRDARLVQPRSRKLQDIGPTYAATVYLDAAERALIERFIDRRNALTPTRRSELAAQIAARVRSHAPPELALLDDESLLERLD